MERKVEDTQPLPLDNLNSYCHVNKKKNKNLYIVLRTVFTFLQHGGKQNHRSKSDEHSVSKENYSPLKISI